METPKTELVQALVNKPKRQKFEKCRCNYCTKHSPRAKQGRIDGRSTTVAEESPKYNDSE